MALKKFRPNTPGTRGLTLVDKKGLWNGKPVKSLTTGISKKGGRNNTGRITMRRKGGGHKSKYRIIDFKRNKIDVSATVERIEYDPNRSCYIMLVKFEDNTFAYYLAPQKIKIGDFLRSALEKQAERDKLYSNQVNPVVAFPGEGTVLFGDKTQLTKPSAFDRINVRRLFILLEKAIANAARFQLFEFNDEFTRSQFVSIVEPFLRDIQGRGGITDFRVVCDASNNTAQVVDSNQFRGDIFIKPSRAINFIQLNFVAVRSGVEFSEVVGAV